MVKLDEDMVKLIIPKNVHGSKVLKTCVRCRQHKTKCDALMTNPLPCTRCRKKNATCMLDTISKHSQRTSNDVIERLTSDVIVLNDLVDRLIERKNTMLQLLSEQGETLTKSVDRHGQTSENTPPISQIQLVLALPILLPEYELPDPVSPSFFCTLTNKSTSQFLLSLDEVQMLLKNYETNFNRYLPILPEHFFNTNSFTFHQENELLFWSIMLTSYLNNPIPNLVGKYQHLSQHIQLLVVETCWLLTPRLVFTIAALLVLTTWPLPNNKMKISDNLSVKYISVMRSLALQFGLHKLEFILEFSHKTNVTILKEESTNDIIRGRIYKFININSNYWLIFLGLSNNNYNGFTQDYIVNKASTIDLKKPNKSNLDVDLYINKLLKISMIQLKLNANMNDLICNNEKEVNFLHPYQINALRMINIKAFEVILLDLYRDGDLPDSWQRMLNVSLEYSRLQVFIYLLAPSEHITLSDYKNFMIKAIQACFGILDGVFELDLSFQQLPIHYRFPVELAVETLLRVYKSPLLDSINDYQTIKQRFQSAIKYIMGETKWLFNNQRLSTILRKFDMVDNRFIMAKSLSFFLIHKMKNYLTLSLTYEMIWFIYEYEKKQDSYSYDSIDWSSYGVLRDSTIYNFMSRNESIFN
ncbi:Zn(II)2Cys6 transcription factor [Kocuria palustris]|nr:Zn(II)2Cys6 transcription factor [Kocuria palustris]